MLACTLKPRPRYLVIVLAFAGDSTITRLFPLTIGALLPALLDEAAERVEVREVLRPAALPVVARREEVVLLVVRFEVLALLLFSFVVSSVFFVVAIIRLYPSYLLLLTSPATCSRLSLASQSTLCIECMSSRKMGLE